MRTTTTKTQSAEITDVAGLDPIQVYWCNTEPGAGHVTITSYGQSWTAYFNAIGTAYSAQHFFISADDGYMYGKLMQGTKKNDVRLRRIVNAVRASLGINWTAHGVDQEYRVVDAAK